MPKMKTNAAAKKRFIHPNKNRYRRFDERTGIGGVQDLEVLLQNGFRHEGNQEGGSCVCTTAEVLHV